MMPVAPAADIPPKDPMDFKKKYKTLKRKMRLLVYEQECFMEELRKTQRKLLKLQRDKSFLLDRLVNYDKVEETSGDSEATASSDSEGEGKTAGVHKKKTSQGLPGQMSSMPSLLEAMNYPNMIKTQPATSLVAPTGIKSPDQAKRKGKVTKKTVKLPGFIKVEPGIGNAPGPSSIVVASPGAAVHSVGPVGHMTREELERHLEMKQSKKPMFMSLEKTPYSLPEDIFSHDNSNSSDLMEKVLKEEDSNLVIDMPR